jgi:regulator of sigma E protease
MQDQAPAGATAAEAAQSFTTQAVGRRIAIVAAGPLFNLILAVLLYAGLNLVGTQEVAAIVAQPAPGTPAAIAGFQAKDRILTIDSKSVASWNDARWQLLDVLATGGRAHITVRSADASLVQRTLVLVGNPMDPARADPLSEAGLRLVSPQPIVQEVLAGSEGQAAGLRAGDIITGAGAQVGLDPASLVRIIQAHAGKPLELSVVRDGVPLSLRLTPRVAEIDGQRIGRIGVQLGGEVPKVMVRYGVVESLTRAALRTWDTAWFSLSMIGRMIVGEVSWRNIGGPVTIADYAGQTARIGVAAYIAYLALISISLGVLNLLPIPMLDGGHLLYYFVEILRGSPPPQRWVEIGQRAGLGLLVGLMALALFNDFTRLFT